MKTIFTTIVSIIIFYSVNASHLMGGEITWRCASGGQYIFQMKVYRDCAGIPFGPPVMLDVHNNPLLTNINLNLVSQIDISSIATCYACSTATSLSQGAVEEFTFESNPITLSGTPPSQGWVFSWGSCCRNATINNLQNPSGVGFTLRAIMYSVNGQSADSCYDSSPYFAEKPATATATGYNFHHTPFAVDPDLDSLVYEFSSPVDQWTSGVWSSTNPPVVPYSLPFTTSNPFPSITTTLNQHTGEVNFVPNYQGIFTFVLKVTSFKSGVISSEIYREMEIVIMPVPINSEPQIVPPFIDPNTSLPTFYDTVYAGDLVSFSISAIDSDFQNVTLEAVGSEFGNGFTDSSSGCLIPPCATLNPAPPITSPIFVSTTFQWQTTPDHLGMNYNSAYMPNTHYFLVRAKDDFCPVHAFDVGVISITVLPVLPKPAITQSNDTLRTLLVAGYSYQWYNNRFKIPGAVTNQYKLTATGNYQVCIVESNNSGNYSDMYHAVVSGVSNIEADASAISVSPNPSKGKFLVSGFDLKDFDLSVTDAVGKIVYQKQFSNYNSNTLVVELKSYDNGFYFLQLKSATKSFNTKVMIRN